MKITVKKIADLHSPAKNIRRHTDKQLAEYVRSLEMFGQIKPIVADENGEIIAGNGLFAAMVKMGKTECDCYIVSGLTPAMKKKMMLADNKVYELGITDMDVFEEIIHDLGTDIDVPGWDTDLLAMLNASADEVTDMIENYGSYDDSAVQTLNSRQREEHTPEQVSTYQPVQPEETAITTHAEATPQNTANATESAQPVGRYVVCQKCGEKIWL